MTNNQNNCKKCRYFLPTGETWYNHPCGYCAHSRVQRRRISDDKACGFFERDTKAPKPASP